MIICFDLDDTLCVGKPYVFATPIEEAVAFVNELYDRGFIIKIYTARGMGRFDCPEKAREAFESLTRRQLRAWNVKYHQLIMGKPSADLYIDDKAVTASGGWQKLLREKLDV